MCTAGLTTERRTRFLSCEALPDVLLHLWPLDVSTCTRLVRDSHRRVSWLSELWLFLRCIEVLGHALVHDLVIENVHDLGKRLSGHTYTVDGLHNPAALDACREGLALGVSWVARLRNDLHDHGIIAARAWRIPQDAERLLLECPLRCLACGLCCCEILGTLGVCLLVAWVMGTC